MSNYHFVDPLLSTGQDILPTLSDADIQKLRTSYKQAIADATAAGDISAAGIYFREMHDGGTVSVNASTQFVPRSLLKVPLVMAVLHQEETGALVPPPLITFAGGANEDTVQDYQPAQKLVVGQAYTPEELMRYTIAYSENNAALLLTDLIGLDAVRDTYTHLGISAPLSDTYTMSVQTYASFFRVLFNASYLNPQHSDQVLAYLSDTGFDRGIVAGVPGSTTVAHKFGELLAPDGIKQLHDCGIVYAPLNPYIICIMTQGSDFKKLEKFLAGISRTTYDAVSGPRP